MKKDGVVLDEEGSLGVLADTHLPGSRDTPCKDQRTQKSKRVRLNDPRADFITEEKGKAAIDSFLPHKGPGPDMLPPCVFQHFGSM